MNDMIERVAIAIKEASYGRITPWEDCVEDFKDIIRAEARAAILAMREPTQEMIDAWYVDNYGEPVPGWQVMIDEALK